MCPQTPGSADADRQGGRIVVCLCRHARLLDEGAQGRVLDHLRGSGLAFDVVDDLCGLAGRGSPQLRRIAASRPVRIVACFPRAVRWLFHAAGAPLPEDGVEILNVRAARREDTEAFLRALPAGSGAAGERLIGSPDDGWVPWFPVIDYSRCQDCRKCLGFCLFGVFALDADGRVVVEIPANCKLNCPACARVCPDVAIIFPKHKGPPINGADVRPEDLRREPAAVDLSKLAGQDVYAALKRRSAETPDRDPKQRLAELQQTLDIPDDVIESLLGEQSKKPKRG